MAESGKKEAKKNPKKDKDADKKNSKDKLNKEDENKDKEKKEEDDMSGVILKGLEQLNELVKTIEEQVTEYIKKKGPLEMTEQYCTGPITNCGPSCLVTTFQPCCCPPPCCKPVPRAAPCAGNYSTPPRCPCCGTICSQK
ncbi:hypothetical protein HELRODRAFT_162603 [Helobdella robusta]|uniref:Uncharacterized protein n=1 Tax=Helobdella robusta TaxID=6412 RepID=T1ESX0_HELRO|nr:hypothetical protein HELRODRAFT_162603 [Helobdella robusta]ESN99112.1 hypothetical protein HELRODRAFT_162603 [Helobdella robusta]